MKDSILLQNVNTETLLFLMDERLKKTLQELLRSFIKQKENDDLLTREEAYKFLKINSSTLWTWTNKGKVKAYGIGSKRYYKRSELLESIKPLKKQI